jgi:hypothetical protein
MKNFFFTAFLVSSGLWAMPDLPPAPVDPLHPGSKFYSYEIKVQKLTCLGREVIIYLPEGVSDMPSVIYGHGQALGLAAYERTLQHLAGKGIAGIYVTYDKGFFDQDWERMGRDFVVMTDCALQKFPQISASKIIFSGHSKGAYVAAIAAGVAEKENLNIRTRSLILFNPVRGQFPTLGSIHPNTSLTVVHSDGDRIVELKAAREMLESVSGQREQLIIMKSYTGITRQDLNADHFWPLTKKTVVGGGPESSFHYYGSWKWLVGGALDEAYLYGDKASGKGIAGIQDVIERNFNY